MKWYTRFYNTHTHSIAHSRVDWMGFHIRIVHFFFHMGWGGGRRASPTHMPSPWLWECHLIRIWLLILIDWYILVWMRAIDQKSCQWNQHTARLQKKYKVLPFFRFLFFYIWNFGLIILFFGVMEMVSWDYRTLFFPMKISSGLFFPLVGPSITSGTKTFSAFFAIFNIKLMNGNKIVMTLWKPI